MAKHHHQSNVDQIHNKAQDAAPVHNGKVPYQARESVKKAQSSQLKRAVEKCSVQLRAYQIHSEKGGSALDNWLEAEQSLKSEHSTGSGL